MKTINIAPIAFAFILFGCEQKQQTQYKSELHTPQVSDHTKYVDQPKEDTISRIHMTTLKMTLIADRLVIIGCDDTAIQPNQQKNNANHKY